MSRTRTLALSFGALVLLTGHVHATGSRISSLGGGVKSLTVEDDRNIFALPSELVKYGTWASIETGTNEGWMNRHSFTVTYQCDPEGAVYGLHGMSGNKAAIMDPIVFQGSTNFANEGDTDTHRGTFLYGRPIGGIDFGLSLSWWGDRENHEDGDGNTEQEQGPSIIQVRPGVGLNALGGEIDLALDGTFSSATDEGTDKGDGSDNSSTELGVTVRGVFEKKDDTYWVPFLGASILSGESLNNDDTGADVEGSSFEFQVGTDVRILVGDALVQPGLGVKYESWSRDVTIPSSDADFTEEGSELKPFFSMAVDVPVTSWMNVYLGGYHAFSFDSEEGTEGASMEGQWMAAASKNRISTGLGFVLSDDLQIDSQLNVDTVRNGGYVLSGEEQDFFLQTSVIYRF
jgi:hypothetical protein